MNGIINSVDMSLSKLWEIVKARKLWPAAVHESQRIGHNLGTEKQKQHASYHVICKQS